MELLRASRLALSPRGLSNIRTQPYGNLCSSSIFTMVRMFLYLAISLKMCIGQFDVKTAFLNSDLKESVWVMSPHGILVYVDDLLILASTSEKRDAVIQTLQSLYKLHVSEDVDMFLGVQLMWKRDKKGHVQSLSMLQPMYTNGVLRRFRMQSCKPAITPMVETFFSDLHSEKDKSTVNAQIAPTQFCHRAVKRVLRYLHGTSSHAVRYEPGTLTLQAYVDADYARD
eukprot:IDg15427t1